MVSLPDSTPPKVVLAWVSAWVMNGGHGVAGMFLAAAENTWFGCEVPEIG